jgi:hypothetical protein
MQNSESEKKNCHDLLQVRRLLKKLIAQEKLLTHYQFSMTFRRGGDHGGRHCTQR